VVALRDLEILSDFWTREKAFLPLFFTEQVKGVDLALYFFSSDYLIGPNCYKMCVLWNALKVLHFRVTIDEGFTIEPWFAVATLLGPSIAKV
jgi:hypothetical protein